MRPRARFESRSARRGRPVQNSWTRPRRGELDERREGSQRRSYGRHQPRDARGAEGAGRGRASRTPDSRGLAAPRPWTLRRSQHRHRQSAVEQHTLGRRTCSRRSPRASRSRRRSARPSTAFPGSAPSKRGGTLEFEWFRSRVGVDGLARRSITVDVGVAPGAAAAAASVAVWQTQSMSRSAPAPKATATLGCVAMSAWMNEEHLSGRGPLGMFLASRPVTSTRSSSSRASRQRYRCCSIDAVPLRMTARLIRRKPAPRVSMRSDAEVSTSRVSSTRARTSSSVVRKLTKHGRRQTWPSTCAGAIQTRPSSWSACDERALCASRSATPPARGGSGTTDRAGRLAERSRSSWPRRRSS